MTILRCLLALLIFPSTVHAGGEPAYPTLVIAIVVDQMRADHLSRYAGVFGEGGFALLRDRGAVFSRCQFGHGWTVTGPGHSVVLSGIDPGRNGIVSNGWYDREAKSEVYCAEDTAEYSIGIEPTDPAGRMSPRRFEGSSLGDILKERSRTSKVVGIAIKDRGAVLPAGHRGDAAYWFDSRSGRWITSTYYRSSLPGWAERFNALGIPESYLGTVWTRLLGEESYASCAPDSSAGEGLIPNGRGIVFPHMIRPSDSPGGRRFEAVLYSPGGNTLTAEFAFAAIAGEDLGRRGVTDILTISFSSTDYAGHVFGPDSHEIMDMYLRLDRELATLFARIDSLVGMGNVLLALTADHGVCPLPELHVNEGGRRLEGAAFMRTVRAGIGRAFGYDEEKERLVVSQAGGFLYLDEGRIRARGWDPVDFEKNLARVVEEQEGIFRAFTRTELLSSIAAGGSADTVQRRVERSFHPLRGGNLAVVTEPYCMFTRTTGTTHGSPWWYDTHIPLVLMGAGVRAGRYDVTCEPVDLAPTLAALLGLDAPAGGSGRVLEEILDR